MNAIPPGEVVERVALPRGFARIRVEHLEITYDTPSGRLTAMEDISFNIEGGEILCLVGTSGCGKSNLFNGSGGFIVPAQDRIEAEGCEVRWPELRRLVVFQEYASARPPFRRIPRLCEGIGSIHSAAQLNDVLGQIS